MYPSWYAFMLKCCHTPGLNACKVLVFVQLNDRYCITKCSSFDEAVWESHLSEQLSFKWNNCSLLVVFVSCLHFCSVLLYSESGGWSCHVHLTSAYRACSAKHYRASSVAEMVLWKRQLEISSGGFFCHVRHLSSAPCCFDDFWERWEDFRVIYCAYSIINEFQRITVTLRFR